MDGPGGPAPGALRRKALKVLPPAGSNLSGSHRRGTHKAATLCSASFYDSGVKLRYLYAAKQLHWLEERGGPALGVVPQYAVAMNKTRDIDINTTILCLPTCCPPHFA